MKTVLDYRLFAVPPLEEEEAHSVLQDAEFYLLTPRYALVYTTGEIYGGVEIRGEKTQALSDIDREWLFSCAATVTARQRAEMAAEMAEEIAQRQRQFLEEFERELRKERESRHGAEETA